MGRTSRLQRHLEVLRTIAEAVSSADVDEVVETSLSALTHVTGHEISSLHLLSADGTQLVLRGDRGLSDRLRKVNQTLPIGQGLVGGVALSGSPRRLEHVRRAPDLLPEARDAVAADRIHAFVCVPVRARQVVLGTLSLGRQLAVGFTDEEVALLQVVADQIGLALEHARLHAETRRQLEELERAQSAVVRAERLSAVGELTRGVAHEINNPLAIILGQVDVLRDDGSGEALPRALQAIEKAARRAAAVVRDLRQFAGLASPQRAPCDLGERVAHALAAQEPRLLAEHVRPRVELEDAPPVWAEAAQIDTLLRHLIDNARQAMAGATAERTLIVRVTPIPAGVRLEVADEGPGISPEHLPRIFNPFFTTKEEARGLGLSVAHGIVREHGGRLWAENSPGGGARFIVELPLGLRGTEVTTTV
jgi:signal transduction histidine kinase